MCSLLLRTKQPIRELPLDQVLPWVLSHGGVSFPPALPLSAFAPRRCREDVICVAVVGHQSFTEAEDTLKLHHIVHCSLDVVDERVNNPKRSGPTLNETCLGMLYPNEIYKVYGYPTITKVKSLMVTTDLDVNYADVRNESEVKHSKTFAG
ncbi:unnamed protein product [Musa acuminata subsp. malaccensis]|uniref:(wild Malaysian banana) hypothetical protein n=1 Tax=Musa acuminata subsp. malaccensis TaxID=214687 RepID=A0A804I6Z4_MUSAM|nr:unnamed protein product [Musa acuminata subsp. malaccensis]